LRFRVFHDSLILTQKTTSAKPFWDGRCGFFMGVFCNRPYDYWIISFPLAPAKSFLNRFAYGI